MFRRYTIIWSGLLTMSPGESLHMPGSLFSLLHRADKVLRVSWEVLSAVITSVPRMSCGGLNQCIPINLSGRVVTIAIVKLFEMQGLGILKRLYGQAVEKAIRPC